MYRPFILRACAITTAGLFAGCAAVPKDAGFGDVQHLVADRTGYAVVWDENTAADQAVAAKVHDLLDRELTADEAAQIALLNNHHLQATFEDLGIAQADLVQAGLLKNPVFDLGVRFPDRGPSSTYLDIGAAEDFLDIALIPARKKLAQAQFDEAKEKVSDEVLSLAAEARAAFYTYQADEQMAQFQQSITEAADAAGEAAKKLHDAGNLNDLDYAGQHASAVRANVDLADAQAAVDEARERVNDVMGVWGPDTEWKSDRRLPDIPAAPLSVADLEFLALRQRPDLVAAHQEVVVQAKTLGLTTDYRFFSEITVGPEFERETDGQWRIGPTISVPLPLFDQGQAKIARAVAMMRQSRQRYIALAADVRSQVRLASSRVQNARAKALLYRDQVLPIERDLMKQTQLHYNGMFIGVFQLLQAKRDEIDAAREYIQALRDYWIARADLEKSLGGRLPTAAPTSMPSSQPAFQNPEDTHGGMQ
jgi:cobalt-zinc-cadmium efflux system outer membrane protein